MFLLGIAWQSKHGRWFLHSVSADSLGTPLSEAVARGHFISSFDRSLNTTSISAIVADFGAEVHLEEALKRATTITQKKSCALDHHTKKDGDAVRSEMIGGARNEVVHMRWYDNPVH